MRINAFELERFFAKYEFSAPYLLGTSDCESLSIQELLDLEPGAEKAFKKMLVRLYRVRRSPGPSSGNL